MGLLGIGQNITTISLEIHRIMKHTFLYKYSNLMIFDFDIFCIKIFQMADTPLLSKASNGQCQATPPPPPRPAPPPQPLRCSSLANNYAGRQQSTSGMPNSY